MDYKVFLVEDDKNLNLILTTYLEKEGWRVKSFLTGKDAREAIDEQPSIWILDIMLPDMDGYQLIKEIKLRTPNLPVIFISARDADIDRVLGLELGSDDYLAKPFLPRELIIRVRNLLDRVYGPKWTTLKIGPYTIEEKARKAKLDSSILDLTSKEFDLLLYLARNQGIALSREQILQSIWGSNYFGTDRAVDDLVRRLRKKMPDLKIETIYGYGYRMIEDDK